MPERQYWPVVFDSAAITQQLCVAVTSGVVPLHLVQGHMSLWALIAADAALLAVGECKAS